MGTLKPIEFSKNLGYSPPPELSIKAVRAKRFFDIVTSGMGLFFVGPLLLLIALLVKTTSPGPIFYHQTRVGYNGQVFSIIKFRTMREDAEKKSGAVWASENRGEKDPRVTPIGNVLRKTHVDELPQLWLILIGTMSIVGPRPERPEFVKKLEVNNLLYSQRVNGIKPGLAGEAQVRCEREARHCSTEAKLRADHAYAIMLVQLGAFLTVFDIWWLDIKVLLKTAVALFKKQIPEKRG